MKRIQRLNRQNKDLQAQLDQVCAPSTLENDAKLVIDVLKEENMSQKITIDLLRVEFQKTFLSVSLLKESNSELETTITALRAQLQLQDTEAKKAGKQEACKLKASTQELKASTQELKALRAAQDKLRGELTAARSMIDSVGAAKDAQYAALDARWTAALNEQAAAAERANKLHRTATDDLNKRIKDALAIQAECGLENIRLAHANAQCQTQIADLLEKADEQTRTLDAARRLLATSATQKTVIDSLRSENNLLKVRKIIEANEHTAVLTYMLLNGQTLSAGYPLYTQ